MSELKLRPPKNRGFSATCKAAEVPGPVVATRALQPLRKCCCRCVFCSAGVPPALLPFACRLRWTLKWPCVPVFPWPLLFAAILNSYAISKSKLSPGRTAPPVRSRCHPEPAHAERERRTLQRVWATRNCNAESLRAGETPALQRQKTTTEPALRLGGNHRS